MKCPPQGRGRRLRDGSFNYSAKSLEIGSLWAVPSQAPPTILPSHWRLVLYGLSRHKLHPLFCQVTGDWFSVGCPVTSSSHYSAKSLEIGSLWAVPSQAPPTILPSHWRLVLYGLSRHKLLPLFCQVIEDWFSMGCPVTSSTHYSAKSLEIGSPEAVLSHALLYKVGTRNGVSGVNVL